MQTKLLVNGYCIVLQNAISCNELFIGRNQLLEKTKTVVLLIMTILLNIIGLTVALYFVLAT